jgi:hypothetical protein
VRPADHDQTSQLAALGPGTAELPHALELPLPLLLLLLQEAQPLGLAAAMFAAGVLRVSCCLVVALLLLLE